MIRLDPVPSEPDGHRVLLLGAHADDIEIGCGGTVLRMAREGRIAEAWWVVFAATEDREREARASAEAFLSEVPRAEVRVLGFRDGYLGHDRPAEVKDVFEELKRSTRPDLVFTHRRADAHQDHRLIGELTWNTFRSHAILEYEVPKYDGDLGQPNVFADLPRSVCERKVELLLAHFPSQAARPWFTADVFRALMRLRGMESDADEGHAEGFHARKLVV